MKQKTCIAMLLAGGQGTRLGILTKNNAKPAVSFGGKYRIIDFSLSNCVNSGIDTVGVLVQYRPLILSGYLGIGDAWDLDVQNGGVQILPPYETQTGGAWYQGTADAIYHNLDFIDNYNPKYVLILSGDHLYNMDYGKMLDEHIEKNADLTISVMEVPIEDASRFGILSADDEGRVIKFAEKPKQPESNLASMGIYIFSTDVLKKALIEDHGDEKSDKDFGKNIIPKLLSEQKRIYTYRFAGYWRDIGTIQSYYDAHMELLGDDPNFSLYADDMKIYSNSNIYPPQVIGPKGSLKECLVCNGCDINGKLTHSIAGTGVIVEEGAEIKESVLLPGAIIKKGAHVEKCIIDENTVVPEGKILKDENGGILVYGGEEA